MPLRKLGAGGGEEGAKPRPNLLAWASGREEALTLGRGQKKGQVWGGLLGATPTALLAFVPLLSHLIMYPSVHQVCPVGCF